MGFGVIGGDGEGLGDQRPGFFKIFVLIGDNAEKVLGHGMDGLGLQDFPVNGLGLGKAAGFVMAHGKVQGLLDVQRFARGLSACGRQASAFFFQPPLAAFFCSVQ